MYKGATRINFNQWFNDQLQASANGFVWSVQQVPVERRNIRPPEGLGEWTLLSHLFHMIFYEKTFALPGMRRWLDNPSPNFDEGDEDIALGEGRDDLDNMLAEFRHVRTEQLNLLSEFDDQAWNSPQETGWGSVTLAWVVSKTYQHTAEHISDVLRIALFWDVLKKRHASGPG